MEEYSEGVINPWEWIASENQFMWGSELRLNISWGTAKTTNIYNSAKPFSGMFAGEDQLISVNLGELWDTFLHMYFLSCVIYTLGKCTSHFIVHFFMHFSNATHF